MSTATAKFQLGVGVVALAAAAALTPVVAQADTTAPLRPALTSFSQGLGDTAGLPVGAVCDNPTSTGDCAIVTAAPANITGNSNSKQVASWFKPVIQNQLWWFGKANPTPPTQTVILYFEPINLPIVGPVFGWFPNINYESCVLGYTRTVGAYGATTISVSRGCA
jgi:hypothetical protein